MISAFSYRTSLNALPKTIISALVGRGRRSSSISSKEQVGYSSGQLLHVALLKKAEALLQIAYP
jgi:hypothetical protein